MGNCTGVPTRESLGVSMRRIREDGLFYTHQHLWFGGLDMTVDLSEVIKHNVGG